MGLFHHIGHHKDRKAARRDSVDGSDESDGESAGSMQSDGGNLREESQWALSMASDQSGRPPTVSEGGLSDRIICAKISHMLTLLFSQGVSCGAGR